MRLTGLVFSTAAQVILTDWTRIQFHESMVPLLRVLLKSMQHAIEFVVENSAPQPEDALFRVYSGSGGSVSGPPQ